MLEVTIISPQRVIFEGRANSVVLPGEEGMFEILPHHRNIVSRLVSGTIVLDAKNVFNIRRGVIKLSRNIVTIITEEM